MSPDVNPKRICLQSGAFFVGAAVLFSCVYFTEIYTGRPPSFWNTKFLSPVLYLSVILIFLKIIFSGFLYDVSVRSTLLGCGLATGIYLSFLNDGYKIFGIYLAVMVIFHFGEFFVTAYTNPSTLSIESFLLTHSLQYGIAAVTSWSEWALEFYFFPDMKKYFVISLIGLAMCLIGEFVRKGAMFNAKTNFNHYVQYKKTDDHVLITHGFYAICRHPSYVGWFYWSVGTQVILLNPICSICYIIASWKFFNERIYYEEYTLLNFFGDQYLKYQQSVSTGLPFIKGYIL